MQLRDAARFACWARAFLRSWRRHPNLNLTMDELGYGLDFPRKVDHILKNHSGVGVKKLVLECSELYDANASSHLDRWLQRAVTPGIEELTLNVCSVWYSDDDGSSLLTYEFPCSVLCNGSGSSIQSLNLICCTFRPTVQLGHLGSLRMLHLCHVGITGDELECLLSNSLVLERLELRDCDEIICLKIPSLMHRLSCLHVCGCYMLQHIESKAQNLRSIYLINFPALDSPGESLQLLKNIDMWCNSAVYYSITELPSTAPNLEALNVSSLLELGHAPTAPSKFLHLRYLCVHLGAATLSPTYDYLVMASFIDASPCLKTFILNLPQELNMEEDWIFGGSLDLRQMPQCLHHNLQSFKVTGFSSAKSLVELTCYILENTTSLECVTLDTTLDAFRCSDNDSSIKCFSLPKDNIMEAHKALLAIETYIKNSK